jgi:hypothetical protein
LNFSIVAQPFILYSSLPQLANENQPVSNHTFHRPQMTHFQADKQPTNNPFGDNFSQLNDNEIFGLEFDRIRKSGVSQTS